MITLAVKTGQALDAFQPSIDRVGVTVQIARGLLHIHVRVGHGAQGLNQRSVNLPVGGRERLGPYRRRQPHLVAAAVQEQRANRDGRELDNAPIDAGEI